MAKLTGPLMSEAASGSIAGFLTFSERKSGSQVRWQRKQEDVVTAPRIEQRAIFLLASQNCRFDGFGTIMIGSYLYGSVVEMYNAKAEGKGMSGYNLCIRESSAIFSV
jgi:hypothetical protein